jgi:hypothetical protein
VEYLVTWISGEEVAYLLVSEEDLCHLGLNDKNCIVTELCTTH